MSGVRGYVSYPFQGFGKGLNLRDKPDAIDPAECIDVMNVYFSDRGALEQRPGYAALAAEALTNRVDSLSPYYTAAGTRQLVAGCGTRLEGLSAAGAVIDSETGLSGGPYDFARFGKPNAEVIYAGNGTDTLRRWNGVEWTAPTATVNGEAGKAMPKAGLLAAWPAGGNRLVAAGFETGTGGPAGAVSSPDHVYLSDPGDPTSWTNKEGEENYLQIFPGNGEKIMAIVPWREFVFIFKETSFVVLHGASEGIAGSATFSFRPVEAGAGLASSRAVCANETGVYFMSRHGVYRTTGEEPEEVTHGRLQPLWTGEVSDFYTGGILAHGSIENCAMGTWRDWVFLSFPTDEANDRTLVFDPQSDWWTITDLPCSCMTSFRVGTEEELLFGYASGGNKIGRHADTFTNDDGAAIASHWRSGWFDLGSPDVKTVRSSKLWGTGKVFAALAPDFEQGVGKLKALDFTDKAADTWGGTTWGSGQWAQLKGLLPAHRRVAVRGTVLALYLTNSILNQGWSVHRVVHHLREIARPTETRS
jgi:hypothetical protein